jgi:hypothetical protein
MADQSIVEEHASLIIRENNYNSNTSEDDENFTKLPP